MITPDLVVRAYANGIFPMAESRTAKALFWVDPPERGVLPLDRFHVPRSLMRVLRRERFEIRCNQNFRAVMEGCAEPKAGRMTTWINDTILALFCDLHAQGLAHCVETWREGRLVGGIYGLALGGAFFGESMFSRETDASKVALAHLVGRLRLGGFVLLDTQFVTRHLTRFGAEEIPKRVYLTRLRKALNTPARFYCGVSSSEVVSSLESIQSSTHRS